MLQPSCPAIEGNFPSLFTVFRPKLSGTLPQRKADGGPMLITKITVERFARSLTETAYDLVVCLHSKEKTVQFSCSIADAEADNKEDFDALLAHKIVRQIKFLPEIRSGKTTVKLAANTRFPTPLHA